MQNKNAPDLTDRAVSVTSFASWPTPRKLEEVSVAAAILIYLAFQVNAVFHRGWWGQDFDVHNQWMLEAMAHPWYFLWHLEPGRTGLPVYEWLTGIVHALVNGWRWLEIVALLSICFTTASLLLLYSLLHKLSAVL